MRARAKNGAIVFCVHIGLRLCMRALPIALHSALSCVMRDVCNRFNIERAGFMHVVSVSLARVVCICVLRFALARCALDC